MLGKSTGGLPGLFLAPPGISQVSAVETNRMPDGGFPWIGPVSGNARPSAQGGLYSRNCQRIWQTGPASSVPMEGPQAAADQDSISPSWWRRRDLSGGCGRYLIYWQLHLHVTHPGQTSYRAVSTGTCSAAEPRASQRVRPGRGAVPTASLISAATIRPTEAGVTGGAHQACWCSWVTHSAAVTAAPTPGPYRRRSIRYYMRSLLIAVRLASSGQGNPNPHNTSAL